MTVEIRRPGDPQVLRPRLERGPLHAPGVTDTEIKIGQTMPYSGLASAYGVIGRTEAAYFQMINEQGGVNGRVRPLDHSSRSKGGLPCAACAAADPGFVHFDVFVRATPDAILVRADHSGAKLMEDLEGCLIAR